jgi:hypothetical protein
MDHWAQGDQACPVDLTGRECFGGLDMATSFDTTCLCLLFALDDGRYWAEPYFWIPEENMRERVKRDRVPYDMWHRQGFLRTTPGNVTDYDLVRADINELAKKYNIRQVAIDRWNATQLSNQLQGDGLNVIGFGQGYGSMSAPAKRLEGLVVGGKVVAAMKRTGASDDFRSNLHRGGSAGVIKITPEERSTAVRAAKRMGLNVCGVDMLRSNHGPVIMEVNSSPGLEGIESATGKDIASMIVDFVVTNAKDGQTKTKGRG